MNKLFTPTSLAIFLIAVLLALAILIEPIGNLFGLLMVWTDGMP